MAAIWEADLHVQPRNAWSVPLGVIQEKGETACSIPVCTAVQYHRILRKESFILYYTLANPGLIEIDHSRVSVYRWITTYRRRWQ